LLPPITRTKATVAFAAVGWFVLAAPARTDPANISKLSRDLKTLGPV
jgi:hypothetical protein